MVMRSHGPAESEKELSTPSAGNVVARAVCPRCGRETTVDPSKSLSEAPCPACGATLGESGSLAAGTRVGGFRIVRFIGRGGMGEVYLAQQISMERNVALKILTPSLVADPDALRRFVTEVRALARLQHPNIVTAHDAGEDRGIHYFAMAYVDGATLHRRIAAGGPMKEGDVLRLMLPLAQALRYAWEEHSILHRDIKPSNIMVDREGAPRLLDLGLARNTRAGGALTVTNAVLGTVNFMSPEQADAEVSLDHRSDIYSLGATAYNALTGRIPFQSTSMLQVLKKQATGMLEDPRAFNPSVSPAAVYLLTVMMARKREHRQATWGAACEDIERVLRGKAPRTPPPEPGASVLAVGVGEGKAVHGPHVQVRSSEIEEIRRHAEAIRQHPPKKAARPSAIGAGLGVGIVAVAVLAGLVAVFRGRSPSPPAGPAQPPAATFTARVVRSTSASARKAADAAEPPASVAAPAPAAPLPAPPLERPAGPSAQTAPSAPPPAPTVSGVGGAAAPEPATAAEDEEAARARAALLDAVADNLLRADAASALRRMREAESAAARAAAISGWDELRAQTELLTRLPDLVVAGFQGDLNKEVTVELQSGPVRAVVRKAASGRIHLRRQIRDAGGAVVGSSDVEVSFAELSPREKARRITAGTSAETALLRGMIALESGMPAAARPLFEQSGTRLGALLIGRMNALARGRVETAEAAKRAAVEHEASRSFAELMRIAGYTVLTNAEAVADAIRRRRFTETDLKIVTNQLATFEARYSGTGCAASNATLVGLLRAINPYCPQIVDQAVLDAAVAKAKRDNPGSVNIEVSAGKNGPVLKAWGDFALTDLSAFSGVPVSGISIDRTGVKDISFARGMPLVWLSIQQSPVDDLSALRGAGTLRTLLLYETKVRDLSPLKGLPLTNLNIRGSVRPSDASPLVGMPLQTLVMNPPDGGRGLEALQGSPVTSITLYGLGGRSNLDFVRGLSSLRVLDLGSTTPALSDLRALEGLELRSLVISGASVSNLAPLRGMPLNRLCLAHSKVRDLAPLADMPLKELDISGCEIKDLGPLRTLRSLELLRIVNLRGDPDLAILREIPTLKRIDR